MNYQKLKEAAVGLEVVENNFKFFENKECEYYPCHDKIKQINCLFCYCPLYAFEDCGGIFSMISTASGKNIKDCSKCKFPHDAKNYNDLMKIIINKYK